MSFIFIFIFIFTFIERLKIDLNAAAIRADATKGQRPKVKGRPEKVISIRRGMEGPLKCPTKQNQVGYLNNENNEMHSRQKKNRDDCG